MNYQVYYFTRWLKDIRYCGGFNTLSQASSYVDFLQKKLPFGKKIVFKIEG